MAFAADRGDSTETPNPVFETPHFQRRRAQNWLFLGLMYAFFYMSRYNLSAVLSAVAEQFGWSYSDYSSVLSVSLLTYGLAVFLNGPLADRIGGKRAILIGAAGAAVFNTLFGLCHLLLLRPAVVSNGQTIAPPELAAGLSNATVLAGIAVIWACNHYFQSFGALSIVKINASWFRLRERGRFAGLFGVMIQAGRVNAYMLMPLALRFLPWQYAFFIPALTLAIMWLVCLRGIENSPAQAGFPELHTGDDTGEDAAAKPTLSYVLRRVFARPEPWVIAFTSMCIGFVRHSIDHYFPQYIGTMFHISSKHLMSFGPYAFVSFAAPAFAVIGGLLAGNASDRLFGSRRAPVICLSFIGMAFCLLFLRASIHTAWLAAIGLVLISMFIQGAHSLVGGAASMDFGGRKAVATAAGLFDGAQYLAGAVIGRVMGSLLDSYKVASIPGEEFVIWPLAPLPFAILGAILIARLWNVLPGRRKAPSVDAKISTVPTMMTGQPSEQSYSLATGGLPEPRA